MDDMQFDGETFDQDKDGARLTGQMLRVFEVMRDGVYRSPDELMALIPDRSSASITARLRDLRKDKFGGHTVNLRRRGDGRRGVHDYQLVVR